MYPFLSQMESVSEWSLLREKKKKERKLRNGETEYN